MRCVSPPYRMNSVGLCDTFRLKGFSLRLSQPMSPATQPYLSSVTCCPQVNFFPNDGECVRPNVFPLNEFSAGALSSKPVSWRFFLNKNSNACKLGVTTSAMIPNGQIQGGVSVKYSISHLHPHSPQSSSEMQPSRTYS